MPQLTLSTKRLACHAFHNGAGFVAITNGLSQIYALVIVPTCGGGEGLAQKLAENIIDDLNARLEQGRKQEQDDSDDSDDVDQMHPAGRGL